jgi:hypothetical protein
LEKESKMTMQHDRYMARKLAEYYADRDRCPWYVIRQAAGRSDETVTIQREPPAKVPRLLEVITIHPSNGYLP